MRISHFSIISIFVFVISLTFTTSAFAQNNTAYSSSNDLGDGNVFFMTAKDLFLPGDLVEINGSLITTNPIVITLDDPHDEIVTSKTTFSDRDGYFTLELKIPTDAEAGIWKIVGTSGIYHKELNFTITGNSNIVTTCYAGNLCSTPIVNTTVQYGPKLVTRIAINSPLQQIKVGVSAQNVKCGITLSLIIKSEDNSPACVKLDTAYLLIKRGWAFSESAYPEGDAQFTLKTNSTIIPGHLPRSSGVRIPYQESSRTINYTGFDGVYNVTLMFRGTPQDYVLKPGSNGTKTFEIEAKASELSVQDYSMQIPKSLNLTNYAVFYHEVTSIKDLAKYPGVTIDDYEFKACFTRPGSGGTCIGGEFGENTPIEAYVVDHPGVNVLFEPPSEVLPLGTNTTSQVVTMMISADSDAPQGTYLVAIPNLGEFLLTVGSQPYHE